MQKPDLNVVEWAVLAQAFYIVMGEMSAQDGEAIAPGELEQSWADLRELLDVEWGHPRTDSDEMLHLWGVMEGVWEGAVPALKAARRRPVSQTDLFDEG